MFTYALIVLAMLISGIAGCVVGWYMRGIWIISDIKLLRETCKEIMKIIIQDVNRETCKKILKRG